MRTFRWNIGVMLLRIGYLTRKHIWFLGVLILNIGYKIRGQVPMKHWFDYGKL
jgi:hypothetical protein